MLPLQYAYLAGDIAFLAVWLLFFFFRKDLRREMLVVSVMLGLVMLVTQHYWWTVDWWRPLTITGTKLGIEDFLIGFASGGIMAVAYEVIFRRHLYRMRKQGVHRPDHITILLLLAFLTSWLFWGVGLTSFWASSIAMAVTGSVLLYFRRDLFLNALLSGVLMTGISLVFYFTILLLSPTWIQNTYQFDTLSRILILGIPLEEYVFWFLAGFVFGPFWEYWQGDSLRREARRK